MLLIIILFFVMYKLHPDYLDVVKVYFKSYDIDHDISYYKNQCPEWHRIFESTKKLQKIDNF